MVLVPTPCTNHQTLPSWLGIIDSHCSPVYRAHSFHTFCPLHSLLLTLPPLGRFCKTDPLLWGWILQGGEVRPLLPDDQLDSARGSVQTRQPFAKNVAGKGRDIHTRVIYQTWNHLIVLLCFVTYSHHQASAAPPLSGYGGGFLRPMPRILNTFRCRTCADRTIYRGTLYTITVPQWIS